jgi:hypothetical protein
MNWSDSTFKVPVYQRQRANFVAKMAKVTATIGELCDAVDDMRGLLDEQQKEYVKRLIGECITDFGFIQESMEVR